MEVGLASRDELQERLGYRFDDPAGLEAALVHSSAAEEGAVRRSEQLEFLGDAVVGLAIGDLLLARYPGFPEGRLSKFRAALVNTQSLSEKACRLGLDREVVLGAGEEKTGGRSKPSILAALFESVVGAVFLDGGYPAARRVLASHFADDVEGIEHRRGTDPKTELQELCQGEGRGTPRYTLIEQSGPDHDRRFVVAVVLGDVVLARGEGTSKRAAEQEAARRVLEEGGSWEGEGGLG